MKIIKYILPLFVLLAACDPLKHKEEPQTNGNLSYYDSVYVTADVQWHKNYYPNLDCEVFSIDLLSEGLSFDSTYHIQGSGLNLYISDIFLPDSTTTLQDGIYRMDTTAEAFTFLPYMYFEGNITGTYLLEVDNSSIKRHVGFISGEMTVENIGEEILLDIILSDSTSHYHATYQGPILYR